MASPRAPALPSWWGALRGVAEHVPEGGWDGCIRCAMEAPGGWVRLLRTCSSGPLHPFAGDDFGADGLGSLTICSWHSYEPRTSYACPLSCILQGVGARGTVFPALHGSRVRHC